ncbi:hypothetical protein CEXT_731021 [Caerostris extrusa]|uniref:Uncharacterized protein n=1 Tax=Caerostris extrusa TaxID=172846 RepID=A0AAV4YD07_CAEEX|nr:hypothetical protein CEXT_731021 [Caerostris extrusa]
MVTVSVTFEENHLSFFPRAVKREQGKSLFESVPQSPRDYRVPEVIKGFAGILKVQINGSGTVSAVHLRTKWK